MAVSPFLTWPVLTSATAGVGTLSLIYYLVGYWDKPGARFFVGAMVAQAGFSFGYALTLTVSTQPLRSFLEALSLASLLWISVPFLGFALGYSGRSDLLDSWTYWTLYGLPLGTTALLGTNHLHGLLWTNADVVTLFGVAGVSYEFNAFFYFVLFISFLPALVGGLLLVDTVWNYGSLYRSEAIAVAVSQVPPAAGVVVWALEIGPYPALNFTAPLLVGHVALDIYAFVGKEMFELHPATARAATESLLDDIQSPILIVDEQFRVVDLNPAAETHLGLDGDDTLTRQLDTVVDTVASPEWDGDVEALLGDGERWEISTQTGTTRYRFSVQPSPLTDHVGDLVGYTLLFQDVTEQTQREERLGVLNRMLRHNLRNDLSVVSGHITAARETPDESSRDEMLATASRKVGSLVETGEMVREFEDLISTPSTYSRQIDVKAVLSDLCEQISTEHPDARFAVDGTAVDLDANPDLFEAVTYQVLENAVVHTDEKPAAVTVDVTPTPSDVRIDVTDTGPGIPDHELRALDHGQEDSLDHGSGFGLWLVKWGTLRMGGDVDFEASDSGTTVRLTLPRQAED